MASGPSFIPIIPVDTYQAARKVFNIQHIYLRIGDHLDSLLAEINVTHLDPTSTRSREMSLRLALVTAFQWAESLPDTLAEEAVLKRMDWKYALYLPMNYSGISAAALCRFRSDLLSHANGLHVFGGLLGRLEALGLFARGSVGTSDPSAVLDFICQLTRFYEMKKSMKAALGVLASLAPDWIRPNALPHWYERYKTGELALPAPSDLARESVSLGIDARQLLSIIRQADSQLLCQKIELRTLGRLFDEQYRQEGEAIRRLLPRCSTCANDSHNRSNE